MLTLTTTRNLLNKKRKVNMSQRQIPRENSNANSVEITIKTLKIYKSIVTTIARVVLLSAPSAANNFIKISWSLTWWPVVPIKLPAPSVELSLKETSSLTMRLRTTLTRKRSKDKTWLTRLMKPTTMRKVVSTNKSTGKVVSLSAGITAWMEYCPKCN